LEANRDTTLHLGRRADPFQVTSTVENQGEMTESAVILITQFKVMDPLIH
jgi:hypothetical protein